MTLRKLSLTVLSLVLLGALAVFALGPRRVFVAGKSRLQRGWLIMNGGLVDVGGHRLRVEHFGNGSQTVVFETGLAQPRTTWGRVPGEVATFAQVVIYDRAGLGESYAVNNRRTSKQIAAELHVMLKNAGFKPPFILVGHSFGGLNARMFASQFPDEVAGIVLVDASHEDEYNRLAALMSEPKRNEYLRHEGGGNFERVDLLASAEEVRTAAALKEMPFIVISASESPEKQNEQSTAKPPCLEGASDIRDCFDPRIALIHNELQSSLARLVPNGSMIVAENSGHFVQWDRPELVISAIRKMVEQVQAR